MLGFGLLVSLMAAPPVVAEHSVCHNQPPPEDFNVELVNGADVGVDTGINDGTGTHVCVNGTSVGVDADDPEDGGIGVVVEVLNCQGDNMGQPCPRVVEHTGASVGGSGSLVVVYFNGQPVN